MRTIDDARAKLGDCVQDAQTERVVITRDGNSVAIIVGVDGVDEEQLDLGTSDEFRTLIQRRRNQETIPRAELEQRRGGDGK